MPMSPRLLRPTASGGISSPLTIPGLGLWLDATDASSYTEASGQVLEMSNKGSRGGSLVQATANNRPTLFESSGDTQNATPATINGNQAFFFDGVNDRLVHAGGGSGGGMNELLRNVPGASLFAVWRAAALAASSWGSVYGITRGSNATRFEHSVASAGLLQQRTRDSVGNVNISGGTISVGVNYFTAAIVDYRAGTQSLRANGSQVASGNTATSGVNNENTNDFNHTLGGFNGNALFFQGTIGEVLIYQRTLSAGEIQAVEGYLRRKWGL